MIILGEETSAGILREMHEDEVETICREVARMASINVASGYPGLDSSGKVPTSVLPATYPESQIVGLTSDLAAKQARPVPVCGLL